MLSSSEASALADVVCCDVLLPGFYGGEGGCYRGNATEASIIIARSTHTLLNNLAIFEQTCALFFVDDDRNANISLTSDRTLRAPFKFRVRDTRKDLPSRALGSIALL